MKSKKGASHVEAIISFIIFAGFLVFLFSIFNPLKKPVNPSLADMVFSNLESNLTTSLSTVSIGINDGKLTAADSCFSINNIADMACGNGRNIIVKNKTKSIVKAEIDLATNKIKIENKNNENEEFYTIYCSDELESIEGVGGGSTGSCKNLATSDYAIGQINTRFPWAESKLKKFEPDYNAKYSEIKDRFIQKANDFGFIIKSVETSELLFNGQKNIPRGINVYAETTPIDMLDKYANITQNTINVIVW